MNKIFTQIALGMVCLFANVANAQVNENFNDGITPLSNKCWKFNNMTNAAPQTSNNNGNNSVTPIEGTYSVRQEIAGSLGELSTPFYVISTPLNVSFKYKISNKLQNSATRVIEIGTFDQNNKFVAFGSSVTLNSSNTQNNSSALTFSGTINTNGTFRVGLRISSFNGDGNSILLIDELKVIPVDATKMTLKYASSCNTKPVATNNIYAFNLGQTVIGNVLKDGTEDNDFDGESLTAVNFIQTDVTGGKINLSADGGFTFEGNPIDGDRITFTYQARDNGYNPELSDVVTVTISFFQASILPVRFTSFTGNAANNKAQLAWSVAENETGNHFQVEKSNDGKTFLTIATVMCSTVSGLEKYNFNDASFNTNGTFYRIKAVNNDQSKTYTQTIYIKGNTSSNGNKLTLLQNPVNSTSLTFNFEATTTCQAEVTIYSFTGSKMHTQKLAVNKGHNTVSLPLSNQYTTGHYILEVKTAENRSTAKFVKL